MEKIYNGENRYMIKWIIFDAMGVVFVEGDDVHKHLVPFIQERIPISKEKIYATYRKASLGDINAVEFWKDIGLEDEYPSIEIQYLESRSDLDKGFLPVAMTLSKKYELGLLSNDISDWSTYLRKKFAIDFFDVVVISGNVYCRKPDLKIFERFLNDANARGEECIFIDDRITNLIAAHSTGMKTIHFVIRDDKSDFIPDSFITSFDEIESAIEEIVKLT